MREGEWWWNRYLLIIYKILQNITNIYDNILHIMTIFTHTYTKYIDIISLNIITYKHTYTYIYRFLSSKTKNEKSDSGSKLSGWFNNS